MNKQIFTYVYTDTSKQIYANSFYMGFYPNSSLNPTLYNTIYVGYIVCLSLYMSMNIWLCACVSKFAIIYIFMGSSLLYCLLMVLFGFGVVCICSDKTHYFHFNCKAAVALTQVSIKHYFYAIEC